MEWLALEDTQGDLSDNPKHAEMGANSGQVLCVL
jgi:hypothetical protein